MSQNILLVIRSDIKALDTKVTALQQQVTDVQQQITDVQSNLPDITELNDKLDAQSATLTNLQTIVEAISDILNPEIPDLPDVPGLRKTGTGLKK
uniref:p10 n=1 Tax=Buzura suppressaria nuclear polyhedrosis virus TaxID=74320 RepID=O55401_NPVBS|nr:P10 [Buzura suppressaria nucleopolyhedrovirus]